MNVKNIVLCFLLSLGFLIFASKSGLAENLDVSALVGDTEINLSGYASPNAIVTFIENDAVVGTTTSNSVGYFSKQFFSQDAGVHTIQIYSTDSSLKTSVTVNLSYVLVLGQSVTISDMYMPPTINVSEQFKKGQIIVVSGYAPPDKVIRIEFSGQEGKIYYEKSDATSGYYSKHLSSKDFSIGKYYVKARVDFTSNVSTESEVKNFQLLESDTTTVTPTSSSARTPTPAKPECVFNFVNICFFDSAKKGFLSLERDLYEYIQNFRSLFEKPSSTYFDINQDGVVDAGDLSIMFYYTKSNFQISSANVVTSGISSVLGTKSSKLEVDENKIDNILDNLDNGAMGDLLTLIILEVAIGLPFLLLAILLIVCWRRYAKR